MRDAVSANTPAAAAVAFDGDAVTVDAAIVASGLGLEPQVVQELMRRGEITGVCEQGIDADAGRHRLTFFYRGRRLRLIVDEFGRVFRRSAIDFGSRPLPERLRRSGA